MRLLFILSALLEILALAALFLAGRKHVLAGLRAGPAPAQLPEALRAKPPRAALIVPVTGDSPAARAGLASLLAQDYPELAVILVTKDQADPATAMVLDLIRDKPLAKHVLAGETKGCGQKNYNLLAGVEQARHLGDVYIFCDATHLAKPNFVGLLLEPISLGQAVLTGGYHRVVPGDFGLATLGLLQVALALHCLQGVRAITQPWGGAMAVTRQVFEQHAVGAIWAKNIVDDYSMGPHLIKQGIRSWPVSLACLDTPLAGLSLGRWQDWLYRQLQYLKFCATSTWLASLPVVWSMVASPVLALGGVLGWSLGILPLWWALAGLSYFAAFFLLGLAFRGLCSRPVPVWAWTKAFTVCFLLTAWCYGRTWAGFKMHWRGMAYRVTWGGVVLEIIRTGAENQAQG